jgi:hypothetical protein
LGQKLLAGTALTAGMKPIYNVSSDLSTLADLLSELQLNVESLSIQGLPAALQGCKDAAETLQNCISEVKVCASALDLACAQVSSKGC